MLTCLYDVVGLFLAWIYESMYLFACLYAYMLGFMSFHVYVLNFYMFTCMFLCLYVQIYVLTCLCAWIYVLYMPYAIFHVLGCSMPCSRAQTQAMFVIPCVIVALLSLYLSFLCFGLMVETRSRPYGLCHHPYTLAHIKGFGSTLFACLCLMLVLASLVHGFATLDALSGFVVVWLRPMPIRPCLDMTIQNASP